MTTLFQISLTTGEGRMVDRSQTSDEKIRAVARAFNETGGELPDSEWSIRMNRSVAPGGFEFTVVHGEDPISRAWLCVDPEAHYLLWAGATAHLARGVPIDVPAKGQWLATALLPTGAKVRARWPEVRLEARRLIHETAWYLLEREAAKASAAAAR